MSLSEISTVLALIAGIGTPGAAVLINYGDQRYVTVAAQNKALIYAIEDEIAAIEAKKAAGTATSADLTRLAVLLERKRNLTQ